MEPFRILVDELVKEHDFQRFDTAEKHQMLELFQKEVIIAGAKQVVTNAIKIYTKSVLDALTERQPERIIFYEL